MPIPRFSSSRGDTSKSVNKIYSYSRSDRPSDNFSIPYVQLEATQVYPVPSTTHKRTLPGSDTLWRPASAWGTSISRFDYKDYHLDVNYGNGRVDTYKYTSGYTAGDFDLNNVGAYFTGRYSTNPTLDIARAETECLLKLAEGKAKMGENLAQAAKTAATFQSVALDFAHLLNHAKRRRLPKGWSTKDIADYYLKWDYGFKPLALDLYTLLEEFRNFKSQAMLITARRTIQSSDSWSNIFLGVGLKHQRECKYRTKVQLTAQVQPGLINSIAKGANQWGLLNPASLAWDLVPWSFVVDWFMPVGNVLDALTATVGLDFVDGYLGRAGEGKVMASYHNFPYPWNSEPNGPRQAESQRFSYTRDLYGGFPGPTVYFKNPFSTSHGVTALALMRQMFR